MFDYPFAGGGQFKNVTEVAHLSNQTRRMLETRQYGLQRKREKWRGMHRQIKNVMYQADANGGARVTYDARIVTYEGETNLMVSHRVEHAFSFYVTDVPLLPAEYAKTARKRKGRRE